MFIRLAWSSNFEEIVFIVIFEYKISIIRKDNIFVYNLCFRYFLQNIEHIAFSYGPDPLITSECIIDIGISEKYLKFLSYDIIELIAPDSDRENPYFIEIIDNTFQEIF